MVRWSNINSYSFNIYDLVTPKDGDWIGPGIERAPVAADIEEALNLRSNRESHRMEALLEVLKEDLADADGPSGVQARINLGLYGRFHALEKSDQLDGVDGKESTHIVPGK